MTDEAPGCDPRTPCLPVRSLIMSGTRTEMLIRAYVELQGELPVDLAYLITSYLCIWVRRFASSSCASHSRRWKNTQDGQTVPMDIPAHPVFQLPCTECAVQTSSYALVHIFERRAFCVPGGSSHALRRQVWRAGLQGADVQGRPLLHKCGAPCLTSQQTKLVNSCLWRL